jgi:hypothetical protein
MVLTTAGCAEPAAVDQLLRVADEALQEVAAADAQFEEAALAQLDQQAATLDEAFVSDMKRLADQEGWIFLEDVLAGKELYNAKRAALDQSRKDLREAFAKTRRNMYVARDLIQYAADLVVRNRAVWYDVSQYVEYIAKSRRTLEGRK